MLVSKDARRGPIMKEHSRKAGLTLVRDQITRAERQPYGSAQPPH